MVQPRKPRLLPFSVQQSANAAIPVCRSFIDQAPQRLQQLRIVGFQIPAALFESTPQSLVELRSRDSQASATRLTAYPLRVTMAYAR